MVVANGVVLVGAVEAVVARDVGAEAGELFVVPPRVPREIDSRAGDERGYGDDPEPAKSLPRKRRPEEVDEGNGENRHPAPGELYEAQFQIGRASCRERV